MPTSYTQLAKELNLTDVYKNSSQLQALREWCSHNFSIDLSEFQNINPEEEYSILQNLTGTYLDSFLPQSQNLNTPNPNLMGFSPIEFAAYQGYIKFLIDHVDNVNPRNLRTPLHMVAALGNLDSVNQLLNAGAPSTPDKENNYPIHLALCVTEGEKGDHTNIDKRTIMYSLLREADPKSIHEVTQEKKNVAHYMAIYGFDKLLTELVQAQNELITAKDYQGYTPAHLAILNGQLLCLNTLLKNESVKNLLDSRGTLLHFSADQGAKEDVAACLKAGITYSPDWNGNTPAMRAILKDNANALSGFTRAQLEQERVGEDEKSLLHFAIQNNKLQCKEWLSDPKNINLNQVEDKNGLLPAEYQTESDPFMTRSSF